MGSLTAQWEHFFNWLRVDDEKEKIDRAAIRPKAALEPGARVMGLLPPARLLDYVENFILYYKETQKIIAQNHQFIGVNQAYRGLPPARRSWRASWACSGTRRVRARASR